MTSRFRKDFIPELDGLRAIAVALVLLVHLPAGSLGVRVDAVRAALLPGNVGVDLFFVLSGFLITRILLVDRGTGVPLRHFLIRRFLRIFPIYYLTIAVLWPSLQWQEIVACATYTSNFAFLVKDTTSPLEHTWSLAVEEHFYLLWPPLATFLAPVVSRRILLWLVLPGALAVGAAVWLLADWTAHGEVLGEFMLRASPVRFFSLGLGALLAYHESSIREHRRASVAVMVGCAALCAASSPAGLSLLAGDPSRWGVTPAQVRGVAAYSIPFGSAAAVISAVAFTGSGLAHAALLRAGWLRSIGRVSYGLYLYHFPVFIDGTFAPGGGPQPLRALLVVALCGALAAASYVGIERPLLERARAFRGATRGDVPARSLTAAELLRAAAFVAALAWVLHGDVLRTR